MHNEQPCIDCGKLTVLYDDYSMFLCNECQIKIEFEINETLYSIPVNTTCCICHINLVCPADGQDTCNDCLRRM